jgi:hypothetical protein
MSPFFVTLVPITDKFENLNRWHGFGCLRQGSGVVITIAHGVAGVTI